MTKSIVFSFILLLSLNVLGVNSKYPARWWKPVPSEGAPKWEILPQEAKKGEVILSKRNELGLHLSNLGKTPLVFRGKKYPGVEGLWQSLKYPDKSDADDPRAKLTWTHTRAEVEQMSSWTAMKAGKAGSEIMRKIKINWVSFGGKRMIYKTPEKGEHYQFIRELMLAKARTNEHVKKVLLSTGGLILRADHHQGDSASPAWLYHEIWMEIRAELQAELKKN